MRLQRDRVLYVPQRQQTFPRTRCRCCKRTGPQLPPQLHAPTSFYLQGRFPRFRPPIKSPTRLSKANTPIDGALKRPAQQQVHSSSQGLLFPFDMGERGDISCAVIGLPIALPCRLLQTSLDHRLTSAGWSNQQNALWQLPSEGCEPRWIPQILHHLLKLCLSSNGTPNSAQQWGHNLTPKRRCREHGQGKTVPLIHS